MKKPPRWLLPVVIAAVLLLCLVVFIVWQTPNSDPSPSPTAGVTDAPPSASASGGTSDGEDFFGNPLPSVGPMTETDKNGREPVPPGRDNRYLNDKVLTCPIDERGATLSVGIDLGENAYQEALYLNPHCSLSEGEDIGYYIYSTPYDVTPQYGEWVALPEEAQTTGRNFIIHNTLDQIKPAAYTDMENYGIMWMDERMGGEQTMVKNTDIYIRVISLALNKLLGSYKLTVRYNDVKDIYELGELTNMDVLTTGYMTEAERDELLDWAYTYAAGGLLPNSNGADAYLTAAIKEECLANSIVEYTGDRTCLPNAGVFEPDGHLDSNYAFISQWHDLVAVNLDCGDMGYLTMYFSPDAEPIIDPANKEQVLADLEAEKDNPQIAFPTPQETIDLLRSMSFAPMTSKHLCFAGNDLFLAMASANDRDVQQVFSY